jgi:hypothetical protein
MKILTLIPWRKSYEAFRGNVYEYGAYRVCEEKHVFVAYHGDKRLTQSAYFHEVEDVIRSHMR